MKLCLCETVLQHWVGEETIADYLLYSLNKRQNFTYVTTYGLSEPTDDIYSLLYHIACTGKLIKNIARGTGVNEMKPDINRAAKRFLAAFRIGLFGDQFADVEKLANAKTLFNK